MAEQTTHSNATPATNAQNAAQATSAPNATNTPNPTLIKNNLEAVLFGIETAIRSLDPNQIKEAKEQKEKTNAILGQVQKARHEATAKATKNPKQKAKYFEEFTKKTQEILAKNTDQKFVEASATKFTKERLDNFHQWIYESKNKITPDDIKNFVSNGIKPPISDPKDQAEFLRFAQFSLLQPEIEQKSLDEEMFMKQFNNDMQKKAQDHAEKSDQSWLDRLISVLFGAKIGPNVQPEQHDEKNAKKTKGKMLSISDLPDGAQAQEILDANGKAAPPTLADLVHLGLEKGVANNNPNYKFHQLAIQNTVLVKTLMEQNSALMPNKVATLYSGGVNFQTNENSWNATISYLNANDNDVAKNKATIINVQMHNGNGLIVTGCSADEGIKNAGFFLYQLDDKGKLTSNSLDNDQIKMRFDFLKDLSKNQEQLENLKSLVIKTDPKAQTYSPTDAQNCMDFVKSVGADGKLQGTIGKYFANNPQKNGENKEDPMEKYRPYYEALKKDPSRFIKANLFTQELEKKFPQEQQTYMTKELNAYMKNPSLFEQSANRNKMSLVEKQDQNHTALVTTINEKTTSYAVQNYSKEKDRALDGENKTTIKEDPKGVILVDQINERFTNAAKNPNDKSVSATRGVSKIDAQAFRTVILKIPGEAKSVDWNNKELNIDPNIKALALKHSEKLKDLNNKKLEALKKINIAYENKRLGKETTNQKILEAQKDLTRILNQENNLRHEMGKEAHKLLKKSGNSVNDQQNAQQLVKTTLATWQVKTAEINGLIPPIVEKAKEETKEKTKDHPQQQPLSAKDLAQNQQHQQTEQTIKEQFNEAFVSVSSDVKQGEFKPPIVSNKLNKELANDVMAVNVGGTKFDQLDKIRVSQTAIQDYSRSFHWSNKFINGLQTFGLLALMPFSGYSRAFNNAMHERVGYGIDRLMTKNQEFKEEGIRTKTI